MANETPAPRVNFLAKYGEVLKQKLSLDDGMFLPTTNQRNQRMLNETTRYARLVRHFIKKVKAIARATDDLIAEADTVITSPLPRQFTLRGGLLQTLDLEGQPSAPPPVKEKLDKAQSLEATESTTILHRDLDDGVFAPLNKWLQDQTEARRKFKTTEGLRYELDCVRRRHASVATRANTDSSENTRSIMSTRAEELHAKMDAMQVAFDAAENETNELLHDLIERCNDVQDIVKQALQAESAALLKMVEPNGFVSKSFRMAAKPTQEELDEEDAADKVVGTSGVAEEPSKGVAVQNGAAPTKSAYAT